MSRHYSSVHFLPREEHAVVYRAHRIRYLPTALDNARRKIAALENEARAYGLTELVEGERP